jgi:flagellar protein FliO/FliZ
MFDFFGDGLAVKLVFAGVVVIALLAAFFWGLRRFGGERLGAATGRGRQPRLAVIDAATVDGRRRLVLIRRDNVEHLLIIGGPTDVVVEQNIVRGAPAAREAAPARAPAAGDALPRTAPLGEGTMWPLQPEPARSEPMPRAEPMPRLEAAPRLESAPRPEPPARPQRAAPPPPPPLPPPAVVEEPMAWSAEPEQPPVPPPQRERRPRAVDPLAGLAEELSRVPTAPEPADIEPQMREASREPQMREPQMREALPRQPLPRREPRVARPQPAPMQPPAPPPAAAPSAPEPQFNSSADQNLAEMAQRLEAALRRPANAGNGGDDARGAGPAPRATESADDEMEEAPPPALPARAAAPAEIARPQRGEAPRPPRAAPAQAAPQKSLYDSLEQEMASLLGRPNSKP